MSNHHARITYSRGSRPVRIIEIVSRGQLVDVLYPNAECDDWRDAEPVLRDAGWRVTQTPRPPAGTQLFAIGRA